MRSLRCVLVVFAAGIGWGEAADAIGGEDRQALLAGVEEVLFAVRRPYGGGGFYGANAVAYFGEETQVVYFGEDPHWYANIGYHCDNATRLAFSGNGGYDGGRLVKLDLATGGTTVLLNAGGGAVRNPQVHYDGTKAVFAYLRAGSHHYHLYEIQLDGSGLRQITDGPYDDFEPTYLPDGGIAFVSTRCCSVRWRHRQADTKAAGPSSPIPRTPTTGNSWQPSNAAGRNSTPGPATARRASGRTGSTSVKWCGSASFRPRSIRPGRWTSSQPTKPTGARFG
ncbi:MAG: hypothetical protein RBS80_11860 [Thermoguttaceae bacterium]|jgi:hypothetical protein|nr:hypothetical protein [Thermoguttaceae bacterium]